MEEPGGWKGKDTQKPVVCSIPNFWLTAVHYIASLDKKPVEKLSKIPRPFFWLKFCNQGISDQGQI